MSFDPSKLPGGNSMFVSTGNPDKDAAIAARIRHDAGNEAEGICPNDCGPMTVDSPTKQHCPVCNFVHQRFVMGGF